MSIISLGITTRLALITLIAMMPLLLAHATVLGAMVETQTTINEASAASQTRVTRLAQQTADLPAEYLTVLRETESRKINKDHLLLRGRKNVLYKNRKRVVEIQALISRRDIASDDTLLSNRIIENNISVIR